jgi:uncharacterized protein YndB with AHSA1/START domain
MTVLDEGYLEESISINAPAEHVWRLVSDPRHMAKWSPQVDSVRLRGGFDQVGLGTEFTNLNREGDLTWKTHGTIVRFDHGREYAFRITENWAVWSFQVESAAVGRTRVIQQRQTPEGISGYSRELTESYLGGQEAFTLILRAGMRQTLDRIKAAAEDPSR